VWFAAHGSGLGIEVEGPTTLRLETRFLTGGAQPELTVTPVPPARLRARRFPVRADEPARSVVVESGEGAGLKPGVRRVIDVAIGAGANRVTSVSFYALDTEAARAEALAEAVRNARAEATVIAESLGYRLGPPLEVNGGAQRPVPRRESDMIMLSAARQAAPTPIEAGDQTVTASVSIRFALGPEIGD